MYHLSPDASFLIGPDNSKINIINANECIENPNEYYAPIGIIGMVQSIQDIQSIQGEKVL